MDYAYDNDVTIIASNSDLDSFHHNYPNTSQHAISVHAIRYDVGDARLGDDVLQLRDLHQLRRAAHAVDAGDRLLVGGGRPLGRIGGPALLGRALQAGLPAVDKAGMRHLTAEEVRQLLIETVDNFYDPERRHRSDEVSDGGAAAERPRLRASLRLRAAERAQRRRRDLRRTLAARGRHPLAGLVRHDLSGQDAVGDDRRRTSAGAAARCRRARRWTGWSSGRRASIRPTTSSRRSATPRCRRWSATSTQPVGRLVADGEQSGAVAERSELRARRSGEQVHRHVARARGVALVEPDARRASRASRATRCSIYKDPDLVAGFPMFLGDSGESSPKIATSSATASARSCSPTPAASCTPSAPTAASCPAGRCKTETLPFLDAAHRQSRQGAGIFRHARSRAHTPAGATAADRRHRRRRQARGRGPGLINSGT